MTNTPPEKQDPHLMRQMFGRVAARYDFITRVFSYGMDRGWKQEAVGRTSLPPGAVVLDLACGTGDFSVLVAKKLAQAQIIAADLALQMVRRARCRGIERAVCADAMRLPFPDAAFDAVFVGYGIRNFPRLQEAVEEIRRVLRPGGTLAVLDFFLPANRVLRRIYLGWLFAQGAFWGIVLHGRPRVYTYIPHSLRSFVSAAEFARVLREAGYTRLRGRTFICGGIALHWAERPH